MTTQRIIHLIDNQARAQALALVRNLPDGWEVVCRPYTRPRTPPQNALLWASALRDLAEQAFVDGRQYPSDVWHEHCKRAFLPEADDQDLALLVRDPEKWVKWADTPSGERLCVGSTTRLTRRGFSDYLDQVYALGAEYGVMFRA